MVRPRVGSLRTREAKRGLPRHRCAASYSRGLYGVVQVEIHNPGGPYGQVGSHEVLNVFSYGYGFFAVAYFVGFGYYVLRLKKRLYN